MSTPTTPKKENPLGKTYWEYYRRNYLVVLCVTIGLAVLATVYARIDEDYGWQYWIVIFAMACINILTFSLSFYQYKKQI